MPELRDWLFVEPTEIALCGKHGTGRVALIEPADVDAVSHLRWRASRDKTGNIYAVAMGHSYLPMHRLIVSAPIVDHINGNTLDNRRTNLRPASTAQNGANRRKQRASSSSGFKGVHLLPGGKWRARLITGGRSLHLGVFVNEADAARAFDAAAREYYGEFAALNFPGPNEQSAHGRGVR